MVINNHWPPLFGSQRQSAKSERISATISYTVLFTASVIGKNLYVLNMKVFLSNLKAM